MKVAIMQPYFLPYIGYFQLISSVDKFIVYDNIKYTKKGWINRNRMLLNGKDTMFTLPLKKDSDHLNIVQRELSSDFDRVKLLNQFKGAYSRAPYFQQTYPFLEHLISCDANNLFRYLHFSLVETCHFLGIGTKICVSSDIDIDHELKGKDKVLSICDAMGAVTYINTIGGTELYCKDDFASKEINLKFIKTKPLEYKQFEAAIVPWLSIVDVLMFNPLDTVYKIICSNFELI
jgi:hypothetical protein